MPLGDRGGAAGTRAARFGTVTWPEHVRHSNEQIVLSVMAEDERAIEQVEQIAGLDGIDLVAIGPTDLSQTLGVSDPKDPRLRARVEQIASEVKRAGKAKLQFPMNHAAFPLTPKELVSLGVGYSHVAPPPPAILLRAMQESVRRVHEATGRG